MTEPMTRTEFKEMVQRAIEDAANQRDMTPRRGANRLPITCTMCKKILTGGSIDTFGDVDLPLCWDCWSELVFTTIEHVDLRTLIAGEFVERAVLDEAINIDEDYDRAEYGLVSQRGMLFCSACGMLAQPGDEEFDWCDHIQGYHCAYNDEIFDEDEDE